MFIDFELLREKGWHIEEQASGVEIRLNGPGPVKCLIDLIKGLQVELDLPSHDAERIADEAYGMAEKAKLMRDLS